jgi:hypothetical protein
MKIGGCRNGGFVNDAGQNNPTYEFYPTRGAPVQMNMLLQTLPANLYPLTWLLPSGKLLIQANRATILFDFNANQETPLDDMPDAVRVYPASAGTIMLPLTPANQWTATVLFCGGSNVANDQCVFRRVGELILTFFLDGTIQTLCLSDNRRPLPVSG